MLDVCIALSLFSRCLIFNTIAGILWDDYNFEKGPYDPFIGYPQPTNFLRRRKFIEDTFFRNRTGVDGGHHGDAGVMEGNRAAGIHADDLILLDPLTLKPVADFELADHL